MADLLLATAGEDVRLWSMPDLTLHSVKSAPSNLVQYCTCSNNGQLIAYANERQGIKVSSLQNDNATIWDIPTAFEQSNVAFSSSSRYLVSGGKDCVVNVWDIKSKSVRRTFRDQINPVSFCVFNFNDKIVASSSDQGEIILNEVPTGLASDPLLGVDTERINCLQYSHFTHNLLASAGGSGAVTLWDTTEKKLLRTFAEHNSSSTSLSFSPLNDMLLCSTGLDKRIIFYDVCYKKIVKIINTKEPLTCCDFLHDGTTVAAGSASGYVYLFDLRQGTDPLKAIPAHRTSVRSVSFQKLVKEKSSKRVSQEKIEKSSSTSNIRTQNVEPPVNKMSEPIQTPAKPSRHSLHLDSSPHDQLESYQSLNENWRLSGVKSTDNLHSPQPKYRKENNEYFSPLELDSGRKPVKRSKSALRKFDLGTKNISGDNESRNPGMGGRSKSGLSKLSLLSRSTGDLTKSTDKKEKENDELVRKNKESQKDSVDGKKGLFKLPFRKKTDNTSKPSDESETSSVESMSIDEKSYPRGKKSQSSTRSRDSDNVFVTQPHKPINELKQVISDLQDNISDESNYANNERTMIVPTPQVSISPTEEGGESSTKQFQIDFVQKMIDEAMEDSRIAVHNDMVNMQVEFIRQMEIQKEQIRQMLECYSINNDLVSEIQRLRTENEMLKRKY